MTFGQALEALKRGLLVGRAGWNGRGMALYLNRGSVDGARFGITEDNPLPSAPFLWVDGVSLTLFERGDKGTCTRIPNINMRNAAGAIVTGWLASQTDMLAEDWEIML